MFIISLFIMVVMLIMTAFSIKNKFASVITLKMLLVSVMMIVGTMYLTKSFSYGRIIGADYRIYLAIKSLGLDHIKLSRLYNACLALYMVFSVVEIRFTTKLRWYLACLMAVPIIMFFVCMDFQALYYFFIQTNISVKYGQLFKFLLENMKYIGSGLLAIYVLIPYITALRAIVKTKIFTKRKFLLVELSSIFLVDSFVYHTFVYTVFKPVFITNVSLYKIPENVMVPGVDLGGFILASFLYFLVFGVVMFLIFFFGTLRVDSGFLIDKIFDFDKTLNKYMSMNMHVYKNAFLAIGQQTNLALRNSDGIPDNVNENLRIIDDIANSQLSILEKNLSRLTIKKFRFEKLDFSECIASAVQKCISDGKAKIIGNYMDRSFIINGDRELLTEAVTNLIINAVEAVKRTERSPVIEINIISEEEFGMITLTDNGTGINKKDYSKIFRSFYSTKTKSACGGIGLNYVKNVIVKHRGEIRVVSKVGEYAQFKIVFPKAEV